MKIWTKEEKKYLIDNHGKISGAKIAKHLGKPVKGIYKMTRKLKLGIYAEVDQPKIARISQPYFQGSYLETLNKYQ